MNGSKIIKGIKNRNWGCMVNRNFTFSQRSLCSHRKGDFYGFHSLSRPAYESFLYRGIREGYGQMRNITSHVLEVQSSSPAFNACFNDKGYCDAVIAMVNPHHPFRNHIKRDFMLSPMKPKHQSMQSNFGRGESIHAHALRQGMINVNDHPPHDKNSYLMARGGFMLHKSQVQILPSKDVAQSGQSSGDLYLHKQEVLRRFIFKVVNRLPTFPVIA